MLFEDREHLVDQRLELIIARVLSILLQLANQFLVVGARLLQEEFVELGAAGGLQFLFRCLFIRGFVSRTVHRFEVPALLRHRDYSLIEIGVILDQLIGVGTNRARRTFFASYLGKLNFHEVGLMYLRENRRGVQFG